MTSRRQSVFDDAAHEVNGWFFVDEEAELRGGLGDEHLESRDGEASTLSPARRSSEIDGRACADGVIPGENRC